jgi:hypothetical protein
MTAARATMTSADREEDLEQLVNARIGSVLDRKWTLDAVLGVGGVGAVYAATHRNGHRVAIKVLHPRHCADQTLATRLERQACAANAVDHPGVVRIFDDGRTDDGATFLVMELLEGEALHGRLGRKTGQVVPSEALGICYGMLDVLGAAHRQGIVHGDVKPENVFITRRAEVKLLDFGDAGAGDDVFGTPGYMAPEQALGRGEEVDARSDLWAVGATLFRMLTGRVPHQAPSLIEQLVDAGTRPVPAFASVLPGVEPSLAALVDRALAFAKADRFEDAIQMQEALRRCAMSGVWGAVPAVPGVHVELASPGRSQAGGAGADGRQATQSEPTLRIYRRGRGGQKKLLVLVGGAAMVVASMFPFVDPRGATSRQDPALSDPSGFPSARASGQRLIQLTPLHRPVVTVPAAVVPAAPRATHAGRRPKARRARPLTSVVADDDLWGRRH